MGRVVLIRPGSTDFDDQQRIQGSLDLPLNDRGHAEVADVMRELRGTSISTIYSAPSDPARSTASRISEGLGVRLKEKAELRNIDQGLWEGLQIKELRRKFPKVFKQWCEAPETVCPPEGETFPQALERVRRVLRKPLKNEQSFAVVVPEPLATLIGCLVEGRKPELPVSIGGERKIGRVEYLSTNGNGAASGKASNKGSDGSRNS